MNLLVRYILLFFFIYDISFVALPDVITSGRIVFIILLLRFIKDGQKLPKKVLNYVVVVCLVSLVSFIQSLFSGDYTQFSRLVFFCLFSILSAYYFAKEFGSLNLLLRALNVVVGIQGAIIVYAFFNPSFKLMLSDYVVFGGNISNDFLYRSFGVTSTSGAALSLIQSIGFISFIWLYKEGYQKYIFSIHTLFALISVVSIFVTGRTGLLVSGATVLLLLLSFSFRFKKVANFVVLISMIFAFGGVETFIDKASSIEGFSINYFTNWISDAFLLKDNNTIDALAKQNVPPLELKTILGTGRVVSEIGHGNASGNDRGYIQTYYSLGLPFTVLFYCWLYGVIFIDYFKYNKLWSVYSVLILFFIEFKEPFIFKYMFPFFLFSVLFTYRFFDKHNKIKSN